MKIRSGLYMLFLLLFHRSLAQEYQTEVEYLDRYIGEAMNQWEVPGLAVCIIKDGQSLLTRGYGLRKNSDTIGVNLQTLFAICSTTKAMTAAGMALLIDAGKARWDDEVILHMPEFRLHDPYVNQQLRIRDLFTHNAGLGNADALWYIWQYSPDEIFSRMQHLPLSYPMRGGYTYQNIMYAVAGRLIEKLSGMSWQAFMQEKLFDPLEMSNTFPNRSLSLPYENRSTPHYKINGVVTPIEDGSADPIAPAGAVWSTIEDMQKWMLFVLDSARVDGERLLSTKNYAEWLKPQSIVSDEGFYPTQALTKPKWKTYALGWFQHDYEGRAVSFHTGSLQGTVAMIGLVPEEKLGVYIFGNLDHAEVRHAIMYKVFDIFGPRDPQRDWSKELLELYRKREASGEMKGAGENIPPTYDLEDYTGIYEDEFLGKLEVFLRGDSLAVKIGFDVNANLEHLRHNTFTFKFENRPWLSNATIRFEDFGKDNLKLYLFNREFIRI
ncbi:MAG: serine hydrolase [Saprospiraceae bacterium]|nr:serine hydrolase [Saprospiraceae bacterium]